MPIDPERAPIAYEIRGRVMMESREAVVDYMMPLGLHHLFAWGHHYGPEPWCDVPGARPDWMPSYYHKADNQGIGFDRSHTGSNAPPDDVLPIHSAAFTMTSVLVRMSISCGSIMPLGNTPCKADVLYGTSFAIATIMVYSR